VISGNRLSIKVRPEVSELSSTGAVVINNIRIPSVAVRRADTTVELASGQSFAIAGLLQSNASNQVQQLPGLGDLPVLGALFRSTTFQRHESELVIIVTAYIVQPVSQTTDLHLPNEGLRFANDSQQLFFGRLTAPQAQRGGTNATSPPLKLSGDAGYLLEPQQ
jgi:pilus assembly protein CpaC